MKFIAALFAFLFISFHPAEDEKPYVVVLGVAQDAGYPQIGCNKDCCKKVYEGEAAKQMVSSIAIVDPVSKQKWIMDATPDFPAQLQLLEKYQPGTITGIFLTHAHIGHYTGLMYLGKEAMNANKVLVYAMPRMIEFIKSNGPWSQLVTLNNIELKKLKADSAVQLNERISVQPLLVPHRDEFSETVGYLIKINRQSVLFIPDIDKWSKWEKDIRGFINSCDYIIVDGTFYNEGELPGRNMAEIPHPIVRETMEMFQESGMTSRKKIWFIHFNHTNPLISDSSEEAKYVRDRGFNLAREGQIFRLH